MGQRLEIRALGGLTVESDLNLTSGLMPRKAAAILVYLAYENHAQSREFLAEMFWPERSLTQSLANLRVAIHSLKHFVEPYITITRDEITMNEESTWWLDATEVGQTLAELATEDQPDKGFLTSKAETLKHTLEFYQGDFLCNFFLRDCARFELWALLIREQLRFQAIHALDWLLRYCTAHGSYQTGIAYASRLLQMDPLREMTYRHLMILLARSGHHSAAVAQYQRYQTLLEERLGLAPSSEATNLFQQICDGEML